MAHGDNVVNFPRTQRRKNGVCGHCLWSCGALNSDSCDHPSVMTETGRPMIKALAARRMDSLCGASGRHWKPKP